jgi:hypothetical protein
VYVVVPRCAKGLGIVNTPIGFDVVTSVLSHEIVEAATDPLPALESTGAYWDFDPNSVAYDFAGLAGEIGDLCEGHKWSFFWDPQSESVVQRIWSNKAARAHEDPCVPKPPDGIVYFETLPRLTETITFAFGGTTYTTTGVDAPVGFAKTIDLALCSDGKTDPWSFTVYQSPLGGSWGTTGNLDITLSQTTGQDGDPVTMTIQRKATDGAPSMIAIRSANAGAGPYYAYFMVSDPPAPH